MFNGRSPASRTPSSRPYIAVLVLIAVFYSKQMYADLKWTFKSVAQFFSGKVMYSLDSTFQMVLRARFYASKMSVSLGRTITLEKVLKIFSSPVKVGLFTLRKQLITFYSDKIMLDTRTTFTSVASFFSRKVKFVLSSEVWLATQDIFKGMVTKYCDLKGRVKK